LGSGLEFEEVAILSALFIDCAIYVDVSLKKPMERETTMDSPLKEQIAPEIIQALIAQANASGLTVNDYLAQLLGLTNGYDDGEAETRALTPYELVEDLIGAVDSSIPDPTSPPRHTAFGAYLAEKHDKEVKRSSVLAKVAAQQGITSDEWVRRHFPNGRDSQGRSLSEALDSLEEDSRPNGTY
jgi:hypothetical protein